MRTLILLVASALAASSALAQQAPNVMRTSMPQGVQIQGNTDLKAQQESAAAVSVGQGNEAKNTAGAITGGTTIQGNTSIKVEQKNARAVAVGKDNKAANEAGVIGGK